MNEQIFARRDIRITQVMRRKNDLQVEPHLNVSTPLASASLQLVNIIFFLNSKLVVTNEIHFLPSHFISLFDDPQNNSFGFHSKFNVFASVLKVQREFEVLHCWHPFCSLWRYYLMRCANHLKKSYAFFSSSRFFFWLEFPRQGNAGSQKGCKLSLALGSAASSSLLTLCKLL